MKEVLKITKALADENRLRIIMIVKDREPCVCQIIEVLEFAPSTVSKHLSILNEAGLIENYKRGRWIYYKLPDKPSDLVKSTLDWVMGNLETSEVVQKDRMKVTSVCEQAPEEIARQQRVR